MRKALDFMLAENDDPMSKYYQKIDVDKIGAMGHSQGGMGTVAAASDARIKAVILWNGGTSASKPFLAVSGDADISGTVAGMRNAADAAPRPAAWLWYHQIPQTVSGSTTGSLAPGHLTLMMESERVNAVTVAWWDMMLKEKPEAKAMFVGDGCTLCDGSAFPSMWSPFVAGSAATPSLEYGHNAMLQ
jgi:pimeloyl-ACP methyl ester carboxylesterase